MTVALDNPGRAAATRAWLSLARKHVTLADLLHLACVSAPSGAIRYARSRARGEPPAPIDPAARDPDFLRVVSAAFRPIAKHYFRWEVRGLEHVPARGPALLVGSHNGGLVNTDAYLTCLAIYDHLGLDRAVSPLMHDWNFYDPVLRAISVKAGGIRASYESAQRALGAGHLVLVYPGSDWDTFRAWRDRHRVELGGRKGFLKLALRERVPVIPVVSAGTHEQFVVLLRGEALARALGLRRALRANVCPVVLALPWGLTSGFLPYVPLPAQTTVAFGPPLAWPELSPAHADDPAVLDQCYAEVRARMQSTLDAITQGRWPFLGQRPTPDRPSAVAHHITRVEPR